MLRVAGLQLRTKYNGDRHLISFRTVKYKFDVTYLAASLQRRAPDLPYSLLREP
jgi:hypothetical protein